MMFKGKLNQYTCEGCGAVITTIDRDEGTTPMFLDCRSEKPCGGRMVSSMYQVDQWLQPTHEWYKPAGKVPPVYREHVEMGGLLIRKIGEAEKIEAHWRMLAKTKRMKH